VPATNVEIDLLVLPGRVDTLGLFSVLGSGALWRHLRSPRTSTVSDGKRVRLRPRGRLGQKT
jgi:hypothetical protein